MRGLRMHYREWGDPSLPVIVFLHGILVSSLSYDCLIEGIAPGRRVLAPDQRGHGETDHADDYSWQQWVDDLEAFADGLELPAFDLVGHSLGADNAARFAGTHPNRVRHLVLLDGGMGPHNSPDEEQFWSDAAHLMPADGFASPDAFVDTASRLFPRADRTAIARWTEWLVEGIGGRWNWPTTADLATFGIDAPTDEDAHRLRRNVPNPVLVVHSQHSELFTGDVFRNVAADYEAGRAETLCDAGHMVMWENVKGTIALISAFLDDCGGH